MGQGGTHAKQGLFDPVVTCCFVPGTQQQQQQQQQQVCLHETNAVSLRPTENGTS